MPRFLSRVTWLAPFRGDGDRIHLAFDDSGHSGGGERLDVELTLEIDAALCASSIDLIEAQRIATWCGDCEMRAGRPRADRRMATGRRT